MKERVGGKRKGFRRVSCINASVPLSQISSLSVSDEFCAECKVCLLQFPCFQILIVSINPCV